MCFLEVKGIPKPRLLVFLALLYLVLTNTECGSTGTEGKCISQVTCGKCIQEDSKCAWCSQENFHGRNNSRCDYEENLKELNCSDIFYPLNEAEKLKDDPLSDKGATEEEAVQIRPQKMRIKLRPHTPVTFSVAFSQAVDYPVDLYYMMDLSRTMQNDLEKLSTLGSTFANQMRVITKNFLLGFGSFVDKVTAPYVDTHPIKLRHPCTNCTQPYDFRNHLKLSNETKEFVKEVTKARTSGNLDSPEGTLDAIMQAVVCKKQIGWRENSRKLLVVTTDNEFHFAGDGKLAGIITPNDCECYLNSSGFYTMSLEQDYPSLSQLNNKIRENNVNLIFAVTADQVDFYRNVSNRLEKSLTSTGLLAEDSSNVVDLIQEKYNEITSSIEMADTTQGLDYIDISYRSACLDGEMKERNLCSKLKVGTKVTFEVTINLATCPEVGSDWTKEVDIYAVGLNEKLKIQLEMMCECDCERSENGDHNSTKCSSGNGTYACGICKCNANKIGNLCQCDTGGESKQVDDRECRREEGAEICSNRGDCTCGKCYCHERDNKDEWYDGTHCECSNFECYKINNKLCNGQGKCSCGECRCFKGWKGPSCTCSTSAQNCVDKNGKTCGGHGTCECNSCKCEDTYYGPLCDECPECAPKCSSYIECVECFIDSRTPELRGEDCDACRNMSAWLVDKVEVNKTLKEKMCSTQDKESCQIIFKYGTGENNRLLIYVQAQRECPTPADVVAIASGTVGSVVAAGVILLFIWKLLTTIHDKREFEKFERERQQAKWDTRGNDLYVEPASTFQNPAYGID